MTKAYDADGNPITVTDPNAQNTTYAYDADGRLMKVTRADGTTVSESYDNNGQLLSQTNGVDATTGYSYDPLGDLVSKTTPGGRTTAYGYDPAGNLASMTDPQERVSTFSYDADNRLTGVSYSGGATHAVGYTYDPAGNRLSMTDGTGTTSYAYNALGWVTSDTSGVGQTASYAYHLDGNPTAITYPNGKTLTDAYNAVGELTSVKDWLGNTTTFAYDPDRSETVTTFPSATHEVDTTTYDNDEQISSVTATRGSTPLASESYARDGAYQITQDTSTFGSNPSATSNYNYDRLERLVGATSGNYAYDPADDPTTQAATAGYTYNSDSELTQAPANATLGTPATSFVYDNLGERTSSTPTTGAPTGYFYDQAQNLTQVIRAASGSTPAINETNTYNGDGFLQTTSNGTATTNLAWNIQTSIPTLLANGTTSIIYGPGDLRVEQITGTGAVSYYHHDQLGSTRLITGPLGLVNATSTYDPYGNLTAHTGTLPILGYAGQYTDPQTGLQYLQARWYDPTTGQLLTQDPLDSITQQPYAYANDNPVNFTDPSGEIGPDLTCMNDQHLPGCSDDPLSDIGHAIGGAASAVGRVVSKAAPVLSPIADAGAGIACAVFDDECSAIVLTNGTVQGGMVAAQLADRPGYSGGDFAFDMTQVFAGSGLAKLGSVAVANTSRDMSDLGKVAIGMTTSTPPTMMDLFKMSCAG